ncbi:MAG TPA: SpoIID/LytB domain-containing protein [Candidatus Marinimicrobia bacterium]|nr:SpoIID/LytB domain-containing protein [Candidatus Neomarinimicrobiota bacterium]
MLVKGKIPKNEPIVSIGLVLPEDCQKSVEITHSETNQNFFIELKNGELVSNGETVPAVKVQNSSTDSQIIVHPVKAGRGFHWEKQISVHVLGVLEITNSNGSLFVANHLPLEQYLMCVATSEMSGECPSALLEVQTIAARSWLLAAAEQKHADLGLDACNDDCCQRYQGMNNFSEDARQSTEASRGQVLTIKGDICDARYSKSCGGITEAGPNVWPQEDLDYLVSVQDGEPAFCGPGFISEADLPEYLGSVDEHRSYFRWDFEILQEELTDHMNKIHSLNGKAVLGIENEKRGPSGRIISCDLVYLDSNNQQKSKHLESEYAIRQTLSPSFLFSSAFDMNLQNVQKGIPGSFSFEGKGWGHGAGMCQIGALGMALSGSTAESILTHYFPKAKLTRIYSS